MAEKSIKKKWRDETAFSSYIEHLTFPADKKWLTCRITARGEKATQKINVNAAIGSSSYSFTCKDKKTVTKTYDVGGKYCPINVTGKLSVNPFPPAWGSVEVECTYDDEQPQLLSKSASWSDETTGISCIDKLFLSADHTWEKCEIKINGGKQKVTGIMVGLIANNDIKMTPVWKVLNGTDSFVYTIDNIQAKTPLLVPGYITNHSLVGAGAKITITGYYYN